MISPKAKKSIILVTEEMIPNVQRFSLTEKLAIDLANKDCNVYLISLKGKGEFHCEGVEHIAINMPDWSLFKLKERIKANLALCYYSLKICYTKHIDLVYGWWPIMFFAKYFAFMKIAADMPEFIDVMYKSYSKPASWLMGPILKVFQTMVARSSEMVVTQSDISRGIWCSRGVNYSRTSSIPYGVETDKFNLPQNSVLRKKYGIKHDDVVVVFEGDIGIDDGVDNLIMACNTLPVKVVIAGDGDGIYMNYIRKLAGANVLFTGWIAYSDMPDFISIADMCVAPFRESLYTNTTCQLKQMESMAAGKATIISELHSFSRYVKNDFDCVLIRPNDVNALHHAVEELVAKPDKRKAIGVNAKETAKSFNWHNRITKESEILRNLINN